MNGDRAALAELDAIAVATASALKSGVDVAICPPFTLIERAVERAGALPIGAQDCHAADKGAHTGCVSAPMLKEAGARLVIVGHSERRADQHETSDEIRAKAEAVIRHGLVVIVCVGETEAERDSGRTLDVVGGQLDGSIPSAGPGAVLVVAYEPVWANGTGRNPAGGDVAEGHAFIGQIGRASCGEGVCQYE